MAAIPKDPVILLSYVNTKLRDDYGTLDELCGALDLDESELKRQLERIGFCYDAEQNRFV